MTQFLEEIIQQENRGKLESFCSHFDFDINELRELVRLNLKYGNPEVMKAINRNNSLAADFKRWIEASKLSFDF